VGEYLDVMVDSVLVNSGRGCINCSGIWASRHTTRAIAEAIAERMGPVQPLPPEDPRPPWPPSPCRSRPTPSTRTIDNDLKEAGVHDLTAKFGPRLVKRERCDYLRPTVILCESPVQGHREEGVHVPVRDGRAVPAGEDAGRPSGRRWCAARSRRTRLSSAD